MDWSIQQIAQMAGTTSRTLRHYDDIGLLPPSRIGANGYRYYDQTALTRLQRILLLRELGLGLPAIAEVLAGAADDREALTTHREWLRSEQDRINRQIESVERTIEALEKGRQLMADEMLDGFDHTHYREEVEQRWGKQAYARGDAWWRGMSDAERKDFGQTHLDIAADYATAFASGAAVDSDEVQAIVQRHYDWIVVGWQGRNPTAEAFMALGDMYVADPRFAANYGGPEGAQQVRDAMAVFAERRL